ncbi:MAG: hypothetical protein QG656_1431, partial [Candidatus Hydrogenedentes bacterium]|nr:hypothetical protein [Candidatus Hydrogenedentota bacterium]
MSNEQAKAQFQRAEELSAQKRYQEALDILEGLYQVLPGSRRVMYQ